MRSTETGKSRFLMSISRHEPPGVSPPPCGGLRRETRTRLIRTSPRPAFPASGTRTFNYLRGRDAKVQVLAVRIAPKLLGRGNEACVEPIDLPAHLSIVTKNLGSSSQLAVAPRNAQQHAAGQTSWKTKGSKRQQAMGVYREKKGGGGDGGIRTLEARFQACSFSKRVPSASRPRLQLRQGIVTDA